MNTEKMKKSKVLIIDDDAITRMLIRASITQWGFTAVEAADGEKAFAILQEEDPPLIIILDWMMPNEDGISLCERFKNQLIIRPYIIIVTHNKGVANQIKAIDAGANAFIEKPINYEELKCQMLVGIRSLTYDYRTLNLPNFCRKIQEDFKNVIESKNLFEKHYELVKNIIPDANNKVFQELTLNKEQLDKAIESLGQSIETLDKEKNNVKQPSAKS